LFLKPASIDLDLPATPVSGRVISRPGRFTVLVELRGAVEEAYLRNPGALSTVLVPGSEVLCVPNPKEGRKTRLDSLAIRIGDHYATVDSHLANRILEKGVDNGLIFPGHTVSAREKSLSGYGRIDFVLRGSDGNRLYVEVKSCTHVKDGVAMFPDRPTERGRRHLVALTGLVLAGEECWIVFVVQRPDASLFRPFCEVDAPFSDLLRQAVDAGLKTLALSTRFIPPRTVRFEKEIPVLL
jgi:sugar fermentation stimulation protein A